MGQMADLKLSAVLEENGRLRAAVGRLQGMLNMVQARDRAMEMEQRFIGAALTGMMLAAKNGALYTSLSSEAITAGRTTARIYIEALTAEAAEAPAAEAEKGAGDVAGE